MLVIAWLDCSDKGVSSKGNGSASPRVLIYCELPLADKGTYNTFAM
jgi:hypothetical protein